LYSFEEEPKVNRIRDKITSERNARTDTLLAVLIFF
jgi:hypothetical protein